ncbi:TPA: type VI secretion system tube protein Hcp [Proteus mirabilis]|nr:type VI secretion system tube protein Hcp [Proteus mirabilis]
MQNRKLNGNKQGLISAGCSSYDSIGNRYQNNHSDEILVYSTDYDISRHQNISHAPFVFEKADDKSSALLLFCFSLFFISICMVYTYLLRFTQKF